MSRLHDDAHAGRKLTADAHDAVDEVKHRMQAGGERVKRAVEGDAMPLGDRVASHVKELGHDVKADLDKTKRGVRDETT